MKAVFSPKYISRKAHQIQMHFLSWMIFPPEGKHIKMTLIFWACGKTGIIINILTFLLVTLTMYGSCITVGIIVVISLVISLQWGVSASHWTDKAWGFLEGVSQRFLEGWNVPIHKPEGAYADTEHSVSILTCLHLKTPSLYNPRKPWLLVHEICTQCSEQESLLIAAST